MTTQVVWLCKHCPQPVLFRVRVETVDRHTLKVCVNPHIDAHMAQHRA